MRLLLIFLHIHPWIGPNVRILVNVRNRDVSVILPEGWKHHVATDIYENKPLELMNEIKLNALEYRIIRF